MRMLIQKRLKQKPLCKGVIKLVLADVVKLGLKAVFCGTEPGQQSTQQGAYYADERNKFWGVLYKIGLTPKKLELINPEKLEDRKKLFDCGLGLTDLLKKKDMTVAELGEELKKKINANRPSVLCFNGKQAAEFFLKRSVDYGKQPDKIGATEIFVLPSTSAAAGKYWDETHWRNLAKHVLNSR